MGRGEGERGAGFGKVGVEGRRAEEDVEGAKDEAVRRVDRN